MCKRILSYTFGIAAALIIIAPPINYSVPLIVNSYHWLYLVLLSGLLGVYLLYTKLPIPFKILSVYLFATCFISEVPYASFNAYIVITAAFYIFLALLKCDFKTLLKFMSAAFILEIILAVMQLCGKDTLMNFNRPERVFLGTILQYHRFSAVLAVMVPLLILKNKKFIFPVILFCVISKSSTFALALAGGMVTYVWMIKHKYRRLLTGVGFLCVVGYLFYDFESLSAELRFGRWTVWPEIIRSNYMDTKLVWTVPTLGHISGPFDWKALMFGRGLDTFLPMFPIYKFDPNPFPQAHSDWLQMSWEIGVVGFGIVFGYCVNLIRRLRKDALLISGLMCMAIVMFFSFPTRMTYAMPPMLVFLAYCEQRSRRIQYDS